MKNKIDLIVLPFMCQNMKNCSQISLWLLVADSLPGIKSAPTRLWRALWSLPLALPPLLSCSMWLNNVSRATGHFLSSKTSVSLVWRVTWMTAAGRWWLYLLLAGRHTVYGLLSFTYSWPLWRQLHCDIMWQMFYLKWP